MSDREELNRRDITHSPGEAWDGERDGLPDPAPGKTRLGDPSGRTHLDPKDRGE
ncbi:MAG: hypothetical protein V4449_00875 [Patescibacteria group bacterium]